DSPRDRSRLENEHRPTLGCEGLLKPIEEGNLRCLQPSACLVEIEPFDTVDLGERLDDARPRRPFQLIGVAHRGRRVEVSLDCPPEYELARLLPDLAEIDEWVVGGFVSGFFRELAPRHGYELLTGLDLTLGDRPVPDVLLDPERSALMS